MQPSRPVCIFLDGSNTYYGAREVCGDREGPIAQRNLRIQWDHLHDVARARRTVKRAIYCGNLPPATGTGVAENIAKAGFEVELFELGAQSHREQAVDQSLQVHMLRCMVDYEPGVAVLVTGDGAGLMRGVGFFADLKRMREFGWRIELVAWKDSCNRHLREWAQREGVFIPLDDHYASVTFVEKMRSSVPVNHRGVVRKAHAKEIGSSRSDQMRTRARDARAELDAELETRLVLAAAARPELPEAAQKEMPPPAAPVPAAVSQKVPAPREVLPVVLKLSPTKTSTRKASSTERANHDALDDRLCPPALARLLARHSAARPTTLEAIAGIVTAGPPAAPSPDGVTKGRSAGVRAWWIALRRTFKL